MERPSVKHPAQFRIGGVIYEVVAYIQLTDAQAGKIARQHHALHPPRKEDRGKILTITTIYDEDSVGLL